MSLWELVPIVVGSGDLEIRPGYTPVEAAGVTVVDVHPTAVGPGNFSVALGSSIRRVHRSGLQRRAGDRRPSST